MHTINAISGTLGLGNIPYRCYSPVDNENDLLSFVNRNDNLIPSAPIGAICGQTFFQQILSADKQNDKKIPNYILDIGG